LNKEKEPKSENDFSSDARILAKIYEYTEIKKKSIWLKGLYYCFRGKLSKDAVDRSLMRLHDLTIIDSDWGRANDSSGQVRCLFIKKGHGNLEKAREFYEMIQEIKERQAILG